MGETSLTKTFKGEVWTANLIISMCTGIASTVLYSVGASPFETAKLTAVLWLIGLAVKLNDSKFDVSTLKDNLVEAVITVVATILAFV